MNQIQLYKWIIPTILTTAVLSFPQITHAGKIPSVRKGHDFTTVPDDADYAPGQLLVCFTPKENGQQRSMTEKNEILSFLGGATIKHNFKVPGLTLVQLPAGQTVKDAVKTFNGTNGILYAEPDYKIYLTSTEPNDPHYQAGNLWGLKKIDANDAWDIHTGSNEIIVAVIDSGVDYSHPDLAHNIWINPGEDFPPLGIVGPEDFNNFDDDNNVYVDDIRGWNFNPNNNNPMDEYGHGTLCAGTIGAVGDNNEGVTGICWNVKIMPLNIATVPYTEEAFVSNAKKAIDYAVDKGAIVLNASWKIAAYSQSLKDRIAAADANGVLFVASAGNPKPSENPDTDENPHYPSSYDLDNIISVMASDENDERSLWLPDRVSAYGAISVDLAAPGSNIYSCDLGGGYKSENGTSMAAAHVSGACALVWSVNPSLSHWDVKRIILETVDQIPALDGLCVTGGRLNVYNAVIKAGQLALTKIDDVNYGELVLPDANIIYTINYGNPVNEPNNPIHIGKVNDVTIVDNLPNEVDFVSATGSNSYDSNSHTVTWQIGTLSPNDINSVTLTVKVNDLAEPLGSITNICVIDGNGIRPTTATETVDVNCWTPDVIYVDADATGSDTGMSWGNAYTDLQDALERAAACYVSQIWVAAGTYKPTTNPADYDANFALVEGVPIYGRFDGTESSLSQRNWRTNETILTGDVDNNDTIDMYTVVSASGVSETAILDGFTITKAYNYGIRCNNASPTIKHNRIKDNYGDGVCCVNSSSPNITNCEIINNGGFGVYLDSPDSVAVIRNNTIAKNFRGIKRDSGTDANITNCILWGNVDDLCDNCSATYSCIEHCNDAGGEGNICGDANDPCFVAPDANNYHLDINVPSPCIDAGDPCGGDYYGETDIDGDPRVMTKFIDMGADEAAYFPPCDPNYQEWLDVNEPTCWCYQRQCHGDTDNQQEGNTKTGYFYVWSGDLSELVAGWKQPYSGDPGLDGPDPDSDPDTWICADFAHNEEGNTKSGYFRVWSADLNILTANWKTNPPANCFGCSQGKRAGSPGKDYTIEEMIDLLEKIWENDEKVRKLISEEDWKKFIESLKEQI